MNLQTRIKPQLWENISTTYQANNFTPAIVNAIHYLSTVLREKSGADGDGVNLVNSALGGDTPRLRINKLQTQSEKDAQRGLLQLLQGIYTSIRNPRSHEMIQDSQETADAIILFIDYLIKIIDSSKEPFNVEEFLDRIFDRDFYPSLQYAELMTSEIPRKKLFDTLVEIYRRKLDGDASNLKYMVSAILPLLSSQQLEDYLEIVSNELKTSGDEAEIRYNLQLLPAELWEKIQNIAKLRIENKLIKSIAAGHVFYANDGREVCNSEGAFGTWANSFIDYFSLKQELANVFIQKIANNDLDEHLYIMKFFSYSLASCIIGSFNVNRCLDAIVNAIKSDNYVLKDTHWLRSFPEEWQRLLEKKLEDVQNESGEPFFKYIDIGDIPF